MKSAYDKTIYDMSSKYFFPNENDGERKAKGSFQLVSWVITHSSLHGSSKIIAAIIASFYNRDKGIAYPSMDKIVEVSGYNKRTVNKAVSDMVESGEWNVTKDSLPFSSKVFNVYTPFSPQKTDTSDRWFWHSSRMTTAYRRSLEQRKQSRERQAENYKRRIKLANDKISPDFRHEYSIGSINQIPELDGILRDSGDWEPNDE